MRRRNGAIASLSSALDVLRDGDEAKDERGELMDIQDRRPCSAVSIQLPRNHYVETVHASVVEQSVKLRSVG